MKKPREALLVIDMLEDFCLEGAALEVPSNRDVMPNIARELRRARDECGQVVYICDAHAPDDPEFRYWPAHAVAGSDGARVVEELAPLPGDIVVEKTTLSSFYNTRLDAVLEKIRPGLITVTGCVTNICVLFTVFDLMSRKYAVRVPSDCVAGLDDGMHEFALKQMGDVLKAEVV